MPKKKKTSKNINSISTNSAMYQALIEAPLVDLFPEHKDSEFEFELLKIATQLELEEKNKKAQEAKQLEEAQKAAQAKKDEIVMQRKLRKEAEKNKRIKAAELAEEKRIAEEAAKNAASEKYFSTRPQKNKSPKSPATLFDDPVAKVIAEELARTIKEANPDRQLNIKVSRIG